MLDRRIELIFKKIFAREKSKNLGLFGLAAHYAYEQNMKALHMKELKEQIYSCKEGMQEVYGRRLVQEIDALPVKYRKLGSLPSKKRLKIGKN